LDWSRWIPLYGIVSILPLFSFLNIIKYSEQEAIIIGGAGESRDNWQRVVVACYNSSGWSRLDDFQSPRYGHQAIINGDKIYVIGGSGTQ